jgi:D-lactate dehydrogenase
MDDIKAILAESELFGKLNDATLEAVSHVAQRRTIPKGELVFREGDPGDYVFVIERGVVEVTKLTDAGVEVPLRELGVGEVGGLTSMSTEKRRSATLRAREESRVVTVAKHQFLDLLAHHIELSQALIMHLSAKVRGKTRQVAALKASGALDSRTKIAFFDAKSYDRNSFDTRLSEGLRIHYFEPRLGPATAGLARGFPIVCAFVNDDVRASVIEQLAASGVELIAMRCAGYNNVDLDAAAAHGISVVRVPAYSPHAVAEHTVALILALNRKVHRAHSRVREGNFSLAGLVGFDLRGKTAGIVGFGKIGQCLAKILRGFDMDVLATDARPNEALAAQLGVRYVSLDELLGQSHIVSLHAPLVPETHHLIDAERIARMQHGVMLINTSRGGLVDSHALIQALKTGQVGSAGLDVYEEESDYFFEDHSDQVITDDLLARLMTFNNVIITSHQAFLTEDALGNIADTTLGNIAEYLAGKRGEQLTNGVRPARK